MTDYLFVVMQEVPHYIGKEEKDVWNVRNLSFMQVYGVLVAIDYYVQNQGEQKISYCIGKN